MTVLPGQKLSMGNFLVSLAAGLMLFLLPKDARNYFESPMKEIMIFVVAVLITASLLLIVRRYESVGVAMLMAMSLCFIKFMVEEIGEALESTEYWPSISYYQLISWVLLCIAPLLTTSVVRLFAAGSWDKPLRRRGFCRFLQFCILACTIVYLPVFIIFMIIPSEINIELPRSYVLIPFERITAYISDLGSNWVYFAETALILLPLGFYLAVSVEHMRWWQLLIVGLSVGITTEIIQFSLNTATACTDDIFLYLIGLFLGYWIKYALDGLRSFLTLGEEKRIMCIFS